MDLGLRDRVVVVVGGAHGIGAATASLFEAEGAAVSVWDIDKEEHQSPKRCWVDVTQLNDITDAWKRTEETFGSIDILVHTVAKGSGFFGFPFYRTPPSAWLKVLEVNLVGMANVAQIAGPAMQLRNSGSMVFLSSVAGQMGSQTDPPYSASKAANINFVQCMAKDLAPHGVRVNCVCPGMVRTSLNESVWQAWTQTQPQAEQLDYDTWAERKIKQLIPLGRWQRVEDVANAIVFLSSPRASEITGQTINVDGGFVMHS